MKPPRARFVLAAGVITAAAAGGALLLAPIRSPLISPAGSSSTARYGSTIVEGQRVRMRDGVVLNATVAYPADRVTGRRAPGRFPVVIEDTPYVSESIPPGNGPVNTYFAERGYISVRVHSRGTGGSGGRHAFFSAREARDGATMVQWAADALDGSDGRIALVGCSFPGGHALGDAAAVTPNSPLRAVVAACIGLSTIQRHDLMVSGVPTPDLGFLDSLGHGLTGDDPVTARFYEDLQREIERGGDAAYERAFWRERLPMSDAQRIADNGVPVLLWTGWHDQVGIGALRTYAALQNAAVGRPIDAPMLRNQRVDPRYQIIVGDWGHAGGLDNDLIVQWLDTWVKGAAGGMRRTRTPMHLFETGTERWINAAAYPMTDRYTLWHLADGDALTVGTPDADGVQSLVWGDASRSDGRLVYTTEPFARGATLAGPMSVTVYARSSNANLELLARVEDVAPDGDTTEITKGAVIGSLRELDPRKSWLDASGIPRWPWQILEKDRPLVPGETFRLDVRLEPRQWGLRPGHRVRLTLTTQPPDGACAGDDPCSLTAPQQASIPGGTYTLLHGPSYPATLNLPQLTARAFQSVPCTVRPTSGGACLPRRF